MPRDGALTRSDVLSPTLSIVCKPCNRHGRYRVARLVEEHGDAKLTELIVTLVNCPKARTASGIEACKAIAKTQVYLRRIWKPRAVPLSRGADASPHKWGVGRDMPHRHWKSAKA
jgi:hypothetical protein